MTLPCGMDHITCFREGVGECVCVVVVGGGVVLRETGVSKHGLVQTSCPALF